MSTVLYNTLRSPLKASTEEEQHVLRRTRYSFSPWKGYPDHRWWSSLEQTHAATLKTFISPFRTRKQSSRQRCLMTVFNDERVIYDINNLLLHSPNVNMLVYHFFLPFTLTISLFFNSTFRSIYSCYVLTHLLIFRLTLPKPTYDSKH